MARYKQFCSPELMQIIEKNSDEAVVEFAWPGIAATEPFGAHRHAAFAGMVVELGRRGTGASIRPKRIELTRPAEKTRPHETHFHCVVKYRAHRNVSGPPPLRP